MAHMPEPLIVALSGHAPDLHPDAWVAPNAALIGQVRLGARASVWYSVTLRAEVEPIEIGEGSNIQDGVTAHVDPGFPLRVGRGVTVGHNAVLHGCTVEDGALIGMGAVILNGAVIGAGSLVAAGAVVSQGAVIPPRSLVAAGAVVSQGAVIPPRSLVAGVPAKVRRELSETEVEHLRHNGAVYEHLLDMHRDTTQGRSSAGSGRRPRMWLCRIRNGRRSFGAAG